MMSCPLESFSLLDTIEEMNDEVGECFKSTFEAIRESLAFKQMFGGGSADLILTEGDLLTAGVEISVQPLLARRSSPQSHEWWGKGLVSSRALLFSIIRVNIIPLLFWTKWKRPDEANVKRFGDYSTALRVSLSCCYPPKRDHKSAADSIYGADHAGVRCRRLFR